MHLQTSADIPVVPQILGRKAYQARSRALTKELGFLFHQLESQCSGFQVIDRYFYLIFTFLFYYIIWKIE